MRIFSKKPGVVRMTKLSAAEKSAEILIYDEIGEGWFGGLGAKEFVQQLAGLGDVDTITVRINSPGGDVFEGIAIYNALKQHTAKISVQIDGLAASIATVIAMAGDTISIADTAMMMVHNPWALAIGDSTDMRKMADLLDQTRAGMMLPAYARTGKSADDLLAIMNAETWYTGPEAVAAGWADSVTAVSSKATSAAAKAKFDLSKFKHAPKAASDDCTCSCDPCVQGNCESCDHVDCDCEGCDCPENISAKLAETAASALKSAENERIAMLSARFRAENLRLAEL
jgi:ATP-dependent protease ClpP protease subunit